MGSYVAPLYTIHRYSESVYKIVSFKGQRDPETVFLREHEEQQHYDNKLANNFSRARSMVLQYALCNPWDYFITTTLDKKKMDRYDLDTYQVQLSQFVRDMRKKYKSKIQVLLVPELHKDGAWHMHGLVYGLPESVLRKFHWPEPQKLIDGGYLNWDDYQRKFGFCSLGVIKNPKATAFYVSKYVSKELSRRSGDLGKHLYFHSRPLKKAEKAADVFLYNQGLDRLCTHEYDFCKTGMVEDAPWYFPFTWDGSDNFEIPLDGDVSTLVPEEEFRPWEIDPFYEQVRIF